MKLQYGEDTLQRVEVYSSSSPKWVVFIHGGAWRDPSNDHSDGEKLLKALAAKNDVSTASIDYRLSPKIHHPEHIKDVLKALSALYSTFKMEQMVLVGHSAGTFLALQSMVPQFYREYGDDNTERAVNACIAVFCVEGIYDLKTLLLVYPSYRDFVHQAFGTDEDLYDQFSPASGLYTVDNAKQLFIVHSPQDELLDYSQPSVGVRQLHNTNITTVEIPGTHNEAYLQPELEQAITGYLKGQPASNGPGIDSYKQVYHDLAAKYGLK